MKKKANRGIDWDTQPLGRVSDHEIARRLGVCASVVQRARTKRKIKPLTGGLVSAPIGIDWGEQPLGEVSDHELARTLRVSHGSVWGARTRRGISPARSRSDIERDHAEMRRLRKKGLTLRDVGEIVGRHPVTVWKATR